MLISMIQEKLPVPLQLSFGLQLENSRKAAFVALHSLWALLRVFHQA